MEGGKWRMGNGEWEVEDGKWRVNAQILISSTYLYNDIQNFMYAKTE